MLAAIGSFLKPFVPQIASAASSLLGHGLASSRQSDAQDFSAGQFATRYQTTVKDLEAAGLNPALAYQQGGGSPPSSTAAGASNFDMSSAQMALVKAQTRKINAEAEVTEGYGLATAGAQLDEILGRTGLTATQVNKVNTEIAKIREEIVNLPFERSRLISAAKQLQNLANLNELQGLSEEQRRSVLRNTASKLVSETSLINFDVKAAESAGNLGREFGQYGPMMKLLLDVIRTAKR